MVGLLSDVFSIKSRFLLMNKYKIRAVSIFLILIILAAFAFLSLIFKGNIAVMAAQNRPNNDNKNISSLDKNRCGSCRIFDKSTYSALITDEGFGLFFDDDDTPSPVVIKSALQLKKYVEKIANAHQRAELGLNQDFADQLAKDIGAFYAPFCERFFENNFLVVALLDRGSGMLKFELTDLKMGGDECCGADEFCTLLINIKKTSPLIQTMDFRHHKLFLTLDKATFGCVSDFKIVMTQEILQ